MEEAQIKFTTPLLGATTLDQQRSINERERLQVRKSVEENAISRRTKKKKL
jgi:hypothetical protein